MSNILQEGLRSSDFNISQYKTPSGGYDLMAVLGRIQTPVTADEEERRATLAQSLELNWVVAKWTDPLTYKNIWAAYKEKDSFTLGPLDALLILEKIITNDNSAPIRASTFMMLCHIVVNMYQNNPDFKKDHLESLLTIDGLLKLTTAEANTAAKGKMIGGLLTILISRLSATRYLTTPDEFWSHIIHGIYSQVNETLPSQTQTDTDIMQFLIDSTLFPFLEEDPTYYDPALSYTLYDSIYWRAFLTMLKNRLLYSKALDRGTSPEDFHKFYLKYDQILSYRKRLLGHYGKKRLDAQANEAHESHQELVLTH